MPEQLTLPRSRVARVVRLAAGALVLAAFAAAQAVAAGAAPAARAAVRQGASAPAGPAPISPLHHPRLCWEAWGNGSPVTLEACDTTLQGQQWTFTGDVLMNGNGYCLQNGGSATAGAKPGQLYLSFSGQCGGTASQRWAFTGPGSQVRNAAAGICAYAQGGLVRGVALVGRPCGTGPGSGTWSQGTSAVMLSAPRHAAPAASAPAASAPAAAGSRAFTAQVTLSNAARAMTAYGVSVSVRAASGLRVTRLTAAGGLTGWTCTARALQCRGNLPGGGRGEITVAGSVTGHPAADAVTVRAAVARTNQPRRHGLSTRVPAHVYTVAASAAGQGGGHTPGTDRAVLFAVIAAGLLLIVGVVLAAVTRRRPVPQPQPAAYPDSAAPAAGATDRPAPAPAGEPTTGKQTR